MNKACTKCEVVKPLSDYRKRRDSKDNHSHICRACLNKDSNEYRNRPEVKFRLKKLGKNYYNKNKDKLLKKMKEYYEYNRESCNQNSYNYAKRNRGKRNALNANKRKATPKWLTKEHKDKIKDIYIECSKLSKKSDVKYEVDHIVPLKNAAVCGLHVPWNLRILEASENKKKSNKLLYYIVY